MRGAQGWGVHMCVFIAGDRPAGCTSFPRTSRGSPGRVCLIPTNWPGIAWPGTPNFHELAGDRLAGHTQFP